MKRDSFRIFAFLSLSIAWSLASRADYDTTIYTPNGSPVTVTVATWEFMPSYIAALNAGTTNAYPNAVFVSTATRTYNCHAYAWASSQSVWMNWPELDTYIADGSYVWQVDGLETNSQVTSYASTLPAGSLAYWPSGDHSGKLNSDGTITSKWGNGPKMRHRVWPGIPADYETPYGIPVSLYSP